MEPEGTERVTCPGRGVSPGPGRGRRPAGRLGGEGPTGPSPDLGRVWGRGEGCEDQPSACFGLRRLDVNGPDLEQAPGPRPNMARVLVRELGWQGSYNPCPQSKAPGGHRDSHGKWLVEESLSAARLVSWGRPGPGLRLQGRGGDVPGWCPACPPSWPCWPCLFDGCVPVPAAPLGPSPLLTDVQAPAGAEPGRNSTGVC